MSQVFLPSAYTNAPASRLLGTDLDAFQPMAPMPEIGAPGEAPKVSPAGGADFSSILEGAVDRVNGDMTQSDDLIQSFVRGKDTSIHDVMLAQAKADVSFRLFTQVGRKVVEAYQEISRLQI